MTLDAAHLFLMVCAGFLSLIMGLLAWSMKGLIDNAKEELATHARKLGTQDDRLNEHGRKIAVLEVRTDSHESSIVEHQRTLMDRQS